ncbi:hypothetical protein BDZ97DRAFT_1903767 [Flammula alnicola]|nr:hypothetical protein BDZ97DRAFT_1903767 [Flammula alnicola]
MANRKSKSGGQSQGPKQAAGGGASRPPNPQATNKPRSVATAHRTAAAPRPPQPQATAHRPSNGTKHQNAGNGAPKSQGANGLNFVRVSLSSAEAMSGHRASQDRSVNQAKRNGSGLNNGPQKVQGHSPQPNISSKNEAPKPKHSQAFFGGHSSASNSALTWSNHIREQGVPRPIADVVAAKQSGHTQPHAQKAQNHAPTPPKAIRKKSVDTASNTFPKVQVATTHAQHPSRGGQSSAPPAQGSEKPSHKSQQQHKGHKDTPPKPSTNKGKPPTESVLSTVFSFFSTGSQAPGNPSHKSQHAQQGRAPPHSRPAQETSNKGKCFGVVIAMFGSADNTPTKTPMNDRGQGQPPTESMLPKVLSSFFSTESEAPGKPSHKSQHAQQHRAPPHSRPVQELADVHKDTPAKSLKNNEHQGQPPAESVLPKVLSSFFSAESKGSGNPSHKSQHAQQHRGKPR